MILEHALLDVIPGQTEAFERDFGEAAQYIASIDGYINHELHRCVEDPNRYLLLARWSHLEAHTVGFRSSAAYLEWKKLLHRYYRPFPQVQHFKSAQTFIKG